MNNTETEEPKQWYQLYDGNEVVMTKLMTRTELEAAAKENEDTDLIWSPRRDVISIQYGYPPVEIRYNEKENIWEFTLRGKERRAQTLENAKKAVDTPPAEKKKPFARFEAYLRTGYSTGSALEKVTVTGVVYSRYRSDQVYIRRANSSRRDTAYLSSLLEVTPENEAIVKQIDELVAREAALNTQAKELAEKLTSVTIKADDYD